MAATATGPLTMEHERSGLVPSGAIWLDEAYVDHFNRVALRWWQYPVANIDDYVEWPQPIADPNHYPPWGFKRLRSSAGRILGWIKVAGRIRNSGLATDKRRDAERLKEQRALEAFALWCERGTP